MITLFTYGPAFGMPDPSPFVMKAQVLLKMSGLDYEENTRGMFKAPKGRMPYISDAGVKIGDTTLIRAHLENRHKIDFEAGLSPSEKAVAWAFEKTCEEHLYHAMLSVRWLDDENFEAGPSFFFKRVPALARPFVKRKIRQQIKNGLIEQGFGAHTQSEIEWLAIKDLRAISDFLGDKKYFMGEKSCGADATIFAFVASALCPVFKTPIRDAGEKMLNLRAYCDRMMAEFHAKN